MSHQSMTQKATLFIVLLTFLAFIASNISHGNPDTLAQKVYNKHTNTLTQADVQEVLPDVLEKFKSPGVQLVLNRGTIKLIANNPDIFRRLLPDVDDRFIRLLKTDQMLNNLFRDADFQEVLWDPAAIDALVALVGNTEPADPNGNGTAHFDPGSDPNPDPNVIVATPVLVSFDPVVIPSPGVGSQLTVHLRISNAQNVVGYQVAVNFDMSALRYVSATDGDYLPSGAYFSPRVSGGSVSLSAASVSGVARSTDGTLASLTFSVIAVKKSMLRLTDVGIADSTNSLLDVQTRDGVIVEGSLVGPTGTVRLQHLRAVRALAFSPDGRILATADGPPPPDTGFPVINLWNPETIDHLESLRTDMHRRSITALVFSPDGRVLASSSIDGNICLWNPRTGDLLRTLTNAHEGGVQSIAFSPDGRVLASGGRDNNVHLWNLQTFRRINTLTRHTDWVLEVAISETGMLASASRDNTIRLWDISNRGQYLGSLQGHTDFVTSVAFVNRFGLVSGSRDMTVRLWYPQGRTVLRTFEGHTDHVHQVSVHTSGMIASPSADGTVRLWDLSSGQNILTFREHANVVRIAAFSPNGEMLASGDESGNVMLRRLPPPSLILRPTQPTPTQAKPAIPHSIELVEDTRLVPIGGYYTATFVVRSADGQPVKGAQVKLSVGQWRFGTVGAARVPLPDGLLYGGPVQFIPDNDSNARRIENLDIHQWKVRAVAADSSNTATTDNEGKATCLQRLSSAGDYGVSATVLFNGREILTTSFSIGDRQNKKYIIPYTDARDAGWGLENGNAYYRVSGGWRAVFASRYPTFYRKDIPEAPPAYRVRVPSSYPWFRCGTSSHVAKTRADGGALGFFAKNLKWTPKDTVARESEDTLILTIKFMNGTALEQSFVKEIAPQWSNHANVKFYFLPSNDQTSRSDIRIEFSEDGTSPWGQVVGYSYDKDLAAGLGTLAMTVDDDEPTMELYNCKFWLQEAEKVHSTDPRTAEGYRQQVQRLVLHEFGHALGLHHEHQNDALFTAHTKTPEKQKETFGMVFEKPFEWIDDDDSALMKHAIKASEEETIEDGREWINTQIKLNRRKGVHFGSEGGPFDPDSIMMYPIQPAWNTVGYSTSKNYQLSEEDIRFIGSKEIYGSPKPVIKLTGDIEGKGAIFNHEGGFLGIGKKWVRYSSKFSRSVTLFIGADARPISTKFSMDKGRVFRLYMGAVRLTPGQGVSIAMAGDIAKNKVVYALNCERFEFKWDSTTEDTLSVAAAVRFRAPTAFAGGKSPALSQCRAEDIGLKLPYGDFFDPRRNDIDAADNAKISFKLTASRFQPNESELDFPIYNSSGSAAPSIVITDDAPMTPQITTLLPNYPNPFNPETWIPYHLAKSSQVTLTIYSIDGKVVRHLDLGHQMAGFYHDRSRAAYWDGRNSVGERVASGLYFYTLMTGDFAATRKMLILK